MGRLCRWALELVRPVRPRAGGGGPLGSPQDRLWIDLYVAFIDTPRGSGPAWWRWVTHDGYRHSFVVQKLGLLGETRLWQIEHVWHSHVSTSVLFLSAELDLPTALAAEGARVVRVAHWVQPKFRWRGPLTCVSHGKLRTCTGRWWRLRPRDWYRELVAEGYVELKTTR